jgi:hypothetical protein
MAFIALDRYCDICNYNVYITIYTAIQITMSYPSNIRDEATRPCLTARGQVLVAGEADEVEKNAKTDGQSMGCAPCFAAAIGGNWRELAKTGSNWQGIGKDWQRTGWNWRPLAEIGRDWGRAP